MTAVFPISFAPISPQSGEGEARPAVGVPPAQPPGVPHISFFPTQVVTFHASGEGYARTVQLRDSDLQRPRVRPERTPSTAEISLPQVDSGPCGEAAPHANHVIASSRGVLPNSRVTSPG